LFPIARYPFLIFVFELSIFNRFIFFTGYKKETSVVQAGHTSLQIAFFS